MAHVPITFDDSQLPLAAAVTAPAGAESAAVAPGSVASLARRSWRDRSHFAVIGTFRHPPNVDALHLLKQRVWPRVRALAAERGVEPAPELHVYGSHLPQSLAQLDDARSGFRVRGLAPEVVSTLCRYRVMLAPLRYGAGVKGKVLDAWRAGTPVATTVVGAEALWGGDSAAGEQAYVDSDGAAATGELPAGLTFGGAVHDDVEALASAAVSLYADREAWARAAETGAAILHANHRDDKAKTALRTLLTERLGFTAAAAADNAAEEDLLVPPSSERIAALRAGDFAGALLWTGAQKALEARSRIIELRAAVQKIAAAQGE